ncbi:MAG: hypothetical protein AABX38_06725 [Candidatus Micrarchaeota archaeon]
MHAELKLPVRNILEIYTKGGIRARQLLKLSTLLAEGVLYYGLASSSGSAVHISELPKNVVLKIMSPSNLPLSDSSFDEVHLSFLGREKTREKINAEIKESARVLKQNGVLIISGEVDARTQDGQDVSHVVIATLSSLGFVVNGPVPKEELISTPLLEDIQTTVGDESENGKFLMFAMRRMV